MTTFSDQLNEMVALYKTHQASIDRSSIRGVRAKKDLYDSLTRRSGDQLPVIKPRLDPCTLHRQSKFTPFDHTVRALTGQGSRNNNNILKLYLLLTLINWPSHLYLIDLITSIFNWPYVSDHPKGYLTKITSDYEAQQDEEISVLKGTMVKVLCSFFYSFVFVVFSTPSSSFSFISILLLNCLLSPSYKLAWYIIVWDIILWDIIVQSRRRYYSPDTKVWHPSL